jgi:hypothetical protein
VEKMSQSDYLNRKKLGIVLRNQQKLEPILTCNDYTHFKTFSLVNTIINEKMTYGQLYVEAEPAACPLPTFQLCRNTNDITLRPNRVTTMTDGMGKRGYTRHHGYNEYTVGLKVNNLIMPCKLLKDCDRFLYLRRNMDKMTNADIELITL